MAVAVASYSPADGALAVVANSGFFFELTDATDIDLDLAELVINGESMTVANGKLAAWNVTDIVGAAVVDDLTDVYFQSRGQWFTLEGEVEWEIFYDSGSLDSGTFYTAENEGFSYGTQPSYFTRAATLRAGEGDGYYILRDLVQSVLPHTADARYVVNLKPTHLGGDADYLVAILRLHRNPGSGTVGLVALDRHNGSGVVEGYNLGRSLGSGVVQGWVLDRAPGAGIVAVEYIYRHLSSGIVGVETLARTPGSGVVYAVNRNNVLEVHVISEATYAALVAAGITFS